jgi:hypothetical protein
LELVKILNKAKRRIKMAKYGRISVALGLVFTFFSLTGTSQDLCTRVDMKPLLSMDQVRMADMAEFLCDLAGLKQLPSWPSPEEIAQMDPESYYRMEVRALADNGFPPIFMEMESDRLVNRRFFNQLLFQIAMETDDKVKADCGGASSETEQVECLTRHDWVYNQSRQIYRTEILSVLCARERELRARTPSSGSVITTSPTPAMAGGGGGETTQIETPATPF